MIERGVGSLLANAPLEVPEPGEMPAAGRAWVLLALFALLMGLLVILLLMTVSRRVRRRYSRPRHEAAVPGTKPTASAWSEAGRRAAPIDAAATTDDTPADEGSP